MRDGSVAGERSASHAATPTCTKRFELPARAYPSAGLRDRVDDLRIVV